MRRIGTIVILALFAGMLIIPNPMVDNAEATSSTYSPLGTGTLNQFVNSTYAYVSNDSYAVGTEGQQQEYRNYSIAIQSTKIDSVEVGVESYVNNTAIRVEVQATINGGTTWCGFGIGNHLYPGTTDTNTTLWVDIASCVSFVHSRDWQWSDLTDANLWTRLIVWSSPSSLHAIFADHVPVRVNHSGAFSIHIKSPIEGVVSNTIDLISFVDTDQEINAVTFTLNSVWYRAEYHSGTDTWRFKNLNTKLLLDGYYTLSSRVNLTDGRFTTDSVLINVQNDYQGCIQDPETGNWNCDKTYPGDRTKGDFDGTLIDPFYMLIYTVNSGEQTGTSINHRDPKLRSTSVVLSDQVFLKEFDFSNRVWINDSDAATILENETYLTYDEPGGVNITIESAVSMTTVRRATIREVRAFNWSYDQNTRAYTVSIQISNTLQYTMNVELFLVAIAPDTHIDPKRVIVRDLTNSDTLDAAQDFGFDSTSFDMSFRGLTSGSTREFTFSYYDFIEGTDILVPVGTIKDSDIQSTKQLRDGHLYTLANKVILNGNDFDYSGRIIIIWQTSELPDMDSIKIDDTDGSNYDFFPESDSRLVIQNVILNAHETREFLFYYDAVEPPDVADVAGAFLPYILAGLIILSLVALITLLIRKDLEPKTQRDLRLLMVGSFFFAVIIGFVVYLLPGLL